MLMSLVRYLQAWRQYGVTLRELAPLNDRELADIGISRSDIPAIAWRHAFGQVEPRERHPLKPTSAPRKAAA